MTAPRLIQLAALAALLSQPIGLAQESSQESKDSQLVFPNKEARADLAAHVRASLPLEPDYVIDRSIAGSRIEPIGGEASSEYRVTIDVYNDDGVAVPAWSGTQNITRRAGDVLLVRPEQLHPAIELQHPFITILAPPGRFPTNGSPLEAVMSLAERLGLPRTSSTNWRTSSYEDAQGPKPVTIFAGAIWGTSFVLDCSDCQVLVHKHHAHDTVDANFAMVHVTSNGSIIAFQTSEWVDVNDPRYLERSDAQERAREDLEVRGYFAKEVEFRGHSLVDERLRYKWAATLQAGSKDNWTHANLETDATTGTIAEGPWTTSAGGHMALGTTPTTDNVPALPIITIIAIAVSVAFGRKPLR